MPKRILIYTKMLLCALFTLLFISSCQNFFPSSNHPSIEFWVDDNTLHPGDCTTIHWKAGPGTVYINGVEVNSSGSSKECLWDTRNYHLELENPPNNPLGDKRLTIVVRSDSSSSSGGSSTTSDDYQLLFWVEDRSIQPGECTWMHWETEGGIAFINDQQRVNSGEEEICPAESTTYHLTLKNQSGAVEESDWISVTVRNVSADGSTEQARGQLDFWADSTTLEVGQCTMLHWDTTGGKPYLDGAEQSPTDQLQICPKTTTEYCLDLDDPQGNPLLSESITITVQPAAPSTATQTQPQPTQPQSAPENPLSFTFAPQKGPPGTEVTLTLNKTANVNVLYDGKILPKKVSSGGKKLIVTIPANSKTAFFRLQGDGYNVRAQKAFQVTYTVNMNVSTDLAITDLYMDALPEGILHIRITNNGPSAVTNTEVFVNCSWHRNPLPGVNENPSTGDSTLSKYPLTLEPGQTKTAPVSSFTLEPNKYEYTCSCDLSMKDTIYQDPNSKNDSYEEKIP